MLIATPLIISSSLHDKSLYFPFLKMGFMSFLSFYDEIFKKDFYDILEVDVLVVPFQNTPHGIFTVWNWNRNILVNVMVVLDLKIPSEPVNTDELDSMQRELKKEELPKISVVNNLQVFEILETRSYILNGGLNSEY